MARVTKRKRGGSKKKRGTTTKKRVKVSKKRKSSSDVDENDAKKQKLDVESMTVAMLKKEIESLGGKPKGKRKADLQVMLKGLMASSSNDDDLDVDSLKVADLKREIEKRGGEPKGKRKADLQIMLKSLIDSSSNDDDDDLNVDSLKVADLKREIEKRGGEPKGKKADLQVMLLGLMASSSNDDDDDLDIDSLKVTDLKKEIKKRGGKPKGKKSALQLILKQIMGIFVDDDDASDWINDKFYVAPFFLDDAEEKEEEESESSEDEDDDDDDDTRVTKSRAKGEFGLSDGDLSTLSYRTAPNPHYRSAAPMCLYLLREVKRISKHKRAQKRRLNSSKKIKSLQKRKAQLEKKKINIRGVKSAVLCKHVFGDFLCDIEKPSRKITVLAKRYNAANILTKMPKIFHKRLDLLRVFQGFKLKKRKKSAREQILEKLDSARKKTELLGDLWVKNRGIDLKLCQFLREDDLNQFKVAMKDSSRIHEGITSAIEIKTRAARMLKKKIDAVVTKANSMNIDGSSLYRAESRMKQDPEHSILGVKATLDRLDEITSSTPSTRKTELLTALQSYGISLRADSKFCNSFINGRSLASADEVAATMKITNFLFGYGHRMWSNYHNSCESSLSSFVLNEGMSWSQACTATMKKYRGRMAYHDDSGGTCIDCGRGTDESYHDYCYECYRCYRGERYW